MVKHHLVYPSRQCSSTPDSFSKEFLNKNNVILLEHPPYTADLIPAEFTVPSTEISMEGTPLSC
jgi:hypothetical protein